MQRREFGMAPMWLEVPAHTRSRSQPSHAGPESWRRQGSPFATGRNRARPLNPGLTGGAKSMPWALADLGH
jgi:hypothetical protein